MYEIDFVVLCQVVPPEVQGEGFLLVGKSGRDIAHVTVQSGASQGMVASDLPSAVQPFYPKAYFSCECFRFPTSMQEPVVVCVCVCWGWCESVGVLRLLAVLPSICVN